jgi:hypothetical protein
MQERRKEESQRTRDRASPGQRLCQLDARGRLEFITEGPADAIVGMIDERTKDLPAERANERRKGFEALFSNGTVSGAREANGFDVFDFVPTEYSHLFGLAIPTTAHRCTCTPSISRVE